MHTRLPKNRMLSSLSVLTLFPLTPIRGTPSTFFFPQHKFIITVSIACPSWNMLYHVCVFTESVNTACARTLF